MSVITAIRQTLRRKEEQTRDQELHDYNSLVVAIADGQEPSVDDVDRILTGGTAERPKLVCPTHPQHNRVRALKSVGDVRECICDDCGTEFKREYDASAAQITGRTVEDLERDIELLKQRRLWKEQLDKLPDIQSGLKKLNDRRERLRVKYEKLFAEQKLASEEMNDEQFNLARQLQVAEQAENGLIANCRDERLCERFTQLRGQRANAATRHGSLKRDLWGYSPVGEIRDPEHGSTGSRMLTYQRHLEKWSGVSTSSQPHGFNLEKERRLYHAFRDREWNPKVEEYERLSSELADIESQVSELLEAMLEP